MMRVVAGPTGEIIVTLAIVVAAVSTLNATIFTGARVFYSMANDMTIFQSMGVWDARGKTPTNGLLAQAAIALALIGMNADARWPNRWWLRHRFWFSADRRMFVLGVLLLRSAIPCACTPEPIIFADVLICCIPASYIPAWPG